MQLSTGFVSRKYDYLNGEVTDKHIAENKLKSTPTTQLVSQITFSNGRTVAYEYDAEERITKVTDSLEGVTEYTYDALGQLLTEKKNNVIVNTMTYDNYGNITEKNGTAYTYDTVWKDKLTGVGNQSITYDAQGNPLSYLGHTLTWEKGRQLKSFDNNSYTYNANGIRTSKTVNEVKHTYILDGTRILKEQWGTNTLIPIYDNEESVCGIIFNSTPYYFQKNLQGDIVEIINSSGAVIAKYSYDAWGVPTITQDTSECNIATVNPFRYRGYYYDQEINLYYLQSRYYNATIGRFVNGDEIGFLTVSKDILINNLYAFCYNKPTSEIELCGNVAFSKLMNVVSKILDFFESIASTAIGMSKEVEDLTKAINSAKKRGGSKDFIDALNKKKKKLIKNTGTIGKIAIVFGLIVKVIEYAPIIAQISKGLAILAEFVAEITIKVICDFISWGASKLCKLIPGFGFLLGWLAGFILDLVASYVFNDTRVSRIKKNYSKRVGNSKSFGVWFNQFLVSVKASF